VASSRLSAARGDDILRHRARECALARKPFSAVDTKGSSVALFFGFTNCPDVCPTTLLDMSNDLAGLREEAAAVKTIFVTVDPERDTPEVLQEYLASFDPR
jgi:protein SCO1/2